MNIDKIINDQAVKLTIDSTRGIQRTICSSLGPLRAGADATRIACHQLFDLAANDREAFVTQTWGTQYLNRVQPMLDQLKRVEESLAKLS